MQIFLIILLILISIILLFIFTDIKIYAEYDNARIVNLIKLRVYAFSYIPVFFMKKELTSSSGGEDSLKNKIDTAIDFFVKSKSDPVEFTVKKVKKSDKIPYFVKNFNFRKIFVEKFSLRLCLDFDNAAASAITSGALNAIMGMVFSKYADNITGTYNYNIFPGYTGNGIKAEASVKAKVGALEIIKALLIKRRKRI